VPTARLALKATALRRPEAGDEVKARFAAAGVEADRLKFLGYEAEARHHLAAYREIDLGLDPFPYNGTTTTCEAMVMGVPVLTLRGDRFIAHVGESLNRAVGLDDWVAADAEDFVHKAVAIAADLPRLAALRAGLRPRLIASPLCDAPRFARHLEAAFRGMWRHWCAGQGARRTKAGRGG
jgi:predicted O-linked N-acetylglucosamine transferase (SPINDLY family)